MRFWFAMPLAVLFTQLIAERVAAQELARFVFREQHMGVDVDLTLYAGNQAAATDAAAKAYRRIADLNLVFSDYTEESETQRLCRSAKPGEAQRVSPDLFRVLMASQALAARSEGAFDVTIGPVTKLWRRARRRKELPSPAELEPVLAVSGHRLLQLDAQAQTVTLAKTGMQLDFGGIAKGYAAAEALQVLQQAGIARALVAVAGDIAAGESPPEKTGWTVGVAPLDPQGTPSRFLSIRNFAASTSGDAFQAVEIQGVRYSHIVNPRTGIGLTRRSSVTVVAPHAMTSDSLATAASVLGPERGLALIENTPDAAALFVFVNEQGQVETRETTGFAKHVMPPE